MSLDIKLRNIAFVVLAGIAGLYYGRHTQRADNASYVLRVQEQLEQYHTNRAQEVEALHTEIQRLTALPLCRFRE